MKRIVFAILLLPVLPSLAVAQTQGDACHVYVLDVAKGRKAFEENRDIGKSESNAKALLTAQTMLPEFRTAIGEEELTTKTYPFPGSKLIIKASVYYTDESMASSEGADSMLLGVAVSDKAHKNAISAENNAVAEVTFTEHTDTVRAKKYVKVNSKLYLVGVECHSKEKEEAAIAAKANLTSPAASSSVARQAHAREDERPIGPRLRRS